MADVTMAATHPPRSALLRALTGTRLGRYVLWNRPTDRDHLRFPSRPLAPAPVPAPLPAGRTLCVAPVAVPGPQGPVPTEIEPLLDKSGTTALVVVRGGEVVFERYGNGGAREVPGRCFSVTKSFASALVGAAAADGFVAGVKACVGDHVAELAGTSIGALTLGHLLEMRSGIRFREGPLPWSDDAICYLSTDCRAAARRAPLTDPVGAYFHYNDYHPFLVGMVLERATGEPVERYFERRLWQPMGAAHPASLTIDSLRHGCVHLESGLNATALDLARFGLLFLRRGVFDGKEIVPAAWVAATTGPEGARRDPDWFRYYHGRPWGRVFSTGAYFYKRFWWGHEAAPGDYDFFAMGALGQHVYVSPRLDVVVVRLSQRFPKGMWWAPVLRQIAEQAAGQ